MTAAGLRLTTEEAPALTHELKGTDERPEAGP